MAAAADLGPLRDLVSLMQVERPNFRAALGRVPAVQVAVDAEGVKKAGSGVEFRRRGRAGILALIAERLTAKERTGIRLRPDFLAGDGIQTGDAVLARLPAHHVDFAGARNGGGATLADVDLPRGL